MVYYQKVTDQGVMVCHVGVLTMSNSTRAQMVNFGVFTRFTSGKNVFSSAKAGFAITAGMQMVSGGLILRELQTAMREWKTASRDRGCPWKVGKEEGDLQVRITFTCRECGDGQELITDTHNYGVLVVEDQELATVPGAGLVQLLCSHCGHVSGELGLGYRYLAEHRPSWEKVHAE